MKNTLKVLNESLKDIIVAFLFAIPIGAISYLFFGPLLSIAVS